VFILPRRIYTVFLFSFFFFLFSFPLFAAEEIPELLERWQAVENALDNWQNAWQNAAEISPAKSTADKLLATLEQFNAVLEKFTGSLLFIQYEGTGLLPKDGGKTTRQMTKELTAAVKRMAETESPAPTLAAKTELTQKADAIRQTLYLWSGMDANIESNVFSRSLYIYGVFILFVIVFIIAIYFLFMALSRSRTKEQDSSEFTRTTLLVQENQRTLISAELHDTVLQDMGRLLQISNDTTPKDPALSELALKILDRTREICRTLMPPDFSRLAFTDSLIQLCADFEKNMGVECRPIIDKNFTVGRLSPQMQLQIYRIIQEALSNTAKHSEAKEVTLMALNKKDALLIYITDDGKGYTPNTESVHSGSGLGIRGMYQRADILGASLNFINGAGSGLTVRLEVPLKMNN
jgi:signal transduction histidine kinase